ncbi:crotonase/enoyl-CoA hydratase family protein [Pseudonocardia lacus]|uniref:crotonase/enoyl-CoA hydratase family protein n=1 Tax=Pseudonocardia lacus TaxID=2835865 RepID=UPI001BDD9155|nr:crotonase/enoyl-CoA hydratase family protein [Pseudonocardia lacus]
MGEPTAGAQPDYEQITLDVADGVATLTLNRPDKLNAFTGKMAGEIIDAFDRTDADDRVKAIVITGAGRGFCAGADLSGGGSTFDYPDDAPRRDGGGLVSLRVYASLKPVIVAFNGPAVGVGVTMTLPADIRLASTKARFGFVFARRGIVPEAASSWFLPRLVGISRALEWATTGRVFDAQEALAGGLVRSLHEPDELLPAAYELAREIADNTAPVSVTMARHMMWKMLGADSPMAAHELDSRAVESRGKSDDAKEGVTSFLEKRTPRYPNRVSTDMPDFFPWWREEEFTPVEGPRSR